MIKHMRINRWPKGAEEAGKVVREVLDMITKGRRGRHPIDVFVLDKGDDPKDIDLMLKDADERFDGSLVYERQDGYDDR